MTPADVRGYARELARSYAPESTPGPDEAIAASVAKELAAIGPTLPESTRMVLMGVLVILEMRAQGKPLNH